MLKLEEMCFKQMLDCGFKLFDDEFDGFVEGVFLLGDVVFKFYDIYGFLFDLMQDVLCEKGCEVDIDGFDVVMEEQKVKVCVVWVGFGEVVDNIIWFDVLDIVGVMDFFGYDIEKVEGQVVVLVQDGNVVEVLVVD